MNSWCLVVVNKINLSAYFFLSDGSSAGESTFGRWVPSISGSSGKALSVRGAEPYSGQVFLQPY